MTTIRRVISVEAIKEALRFLRSSAEKGRRLDLGTEGWDRLNAAEGELVVLEGIVNRPVAHHFIIYGMPRTKKTSNQGVVVAGKSGKPRAMMFPAKDWRQWCKDAPMKFITERPTRPLTQRFSCRAHYFMSARQHGDAVGYNQGLADFLEVRGIPGIEERGLLENDRLIIDWDGTRGPWHGSQFVDPMQPRVEVMLTVVPLTL